jgi:hypothetical protein
MLFPAFRMQHTLRTAILGVHFWERCSEHRIRLVNGQRVAVGAFAQMNINEKKYENLTDGEHKILHPRDEMAMLILESTGTVNYRKQKAKERARLLQLEKEQKERETLDNNNQEGNHRNNNNNKHHETPQHISHLPTNHDIPNRYSNHITDTHKQANAKFGKALSGIHPHTTKEEEDNAPCGGTQHHHTNNHHQHFQDRTVERMLDGINKKDNFGGVKLLGVAGGHADPHHHVVVHHTVDSPSSLTVNTDNPQHHHHHMSHHHQQHPSHGHHHQHDELD